MMIRGLRTSLFQGRRLLHTSCVCQAVDKASLSKLRKKTGYPFINCKNALEKFDNDLKQAEKWLRDEAQKAGWAKANKLADRPMSQGLIGLTVDKNVATMVEVNCETDFVSRNKKFHSLLSDLSSACMTFGKNTGSSKVYLGKEALGQMPVREGTTVADAVATEVGTVGENMLARRGVFLQVPENSFIASYVHASGPESESNRIGKMTMGKYGSLVVYQKSPGESPVPVEELGRQLCQHVVGMNPTKVGNPDTDKPCKNSDDETAMIYQEFLMDNSQTVGEVLEQNNLQVLDFVRFECGEELPEDEDS